MKLLTSKRFEYLECKLTNIRADVEQCYLLISPTTRQLFQRVKLSINTVVAGAAKVHLSQRERI
ncbi:MAG: hypothetical protein WDO15_02375 [Bacteroidota bacterium]